MIDTALFIDSEKNNTFELAALEKSLNDIKQTSFDYLYDLQRKAVNYRRFDLTMSDLTLDKNVSRKSTRTYPKKYIAHVPESFIAEKNRIAYMRSSLYRKELNVFDVSNNPKLFSHVYIVFIDGKYYDTVNIRCKESVTELIFDIHETTINPTGIPDSHFKQLMDKNAKITIFFLQNAEYGIYKTNRHVLSMYKDHLALSRFDLKNNLTDNTKYITFINSSKLLFSSVITDTTNSTDMLKFFDNNLRSFDSKLVHLNVFGFRNLLDQYNVLGSTKFFTIPLQDMPVPVENLMIFKNDANGNKTFAHGITAKLYYPNVYEVIGNTNNENLTIYAFYFDDTVSGGLKFNNELKIYHDLFGNDIGRYVSNAIPASIKTHDPKLLSYDIKDYMESTHADNTLKYKIEKLKDWITKNPDVLRTYLSNQIKTNNGYIIDVSKVNLADKLRNNNHQDVDYGYEKETFMEPRYVFILSNTSSDMYLDIRFYIDGVLFVPDKTYKDSEYEYYYIPVSLVTPTSIIEIERFSEVEYQKSWTFNSPIEKKELVLRSDMTFSPSDVYVVDPATNKFVPRDKFRLIVIKNGIEIELEPSSLKTLKGSVHIRLIDASLLARPMFIFVRRHIYFEEKVIKENDDIGSVFFFESKTQYDLENVRIFKNGRLLSSSLYDVDFDPTVNAKNFVTPIIRKKIGDRFVVDCTPFKYKTVYEQSGIDTNGFVDLRGIITKPFDLAWFDVYLNGRRLNKNHVDIISPTLIFIHGVMSLKNLIILEKNRDEEYFQMGSAKTLNDTLWDTDSEFRITLSNRYSLTDSEQDIVTELENVLEFEKMRLFLLLIGSERMIDPDVFQISEDERRRFPNMFNTSQDFFFINPDDNYKAVSRMKIYPEYSKGYNE